MIKISFKDSKFHEPKVVTRIGKTMRVTLDGVLLWELWSDIPFSIKAWAHTRRGINIFTSEGTTYIMVSGSAACHKEDKFDYVVGERLAEARAKIKLYSFIVELLQKVSSYYLKLIFGYEIVSTIAPIGPCIAKDIERYAGLRKHEVEHLEALIKEIKENKEIESLTNV